MAIEMHSVADNLRFTLAANINDSVTSLDVGAGEGTTAPAVPFWIKKYNGSEQMKVTNVATDTFTVVRAANGTVASAHSAGDFLDIDIVAAQVTELHSADTELHALLWAMTGAADGVFRRPLPALEVVAQGTPDMTVKVQSGSGIVSATGVVLSADTNTATLVAPVSNPRIDLVQISKLNVISVKGGAEAGSPSSPTVDTDNIELAEIYHRVGETSIKDADDASNGYITDTRSFR